MRLTSQKYWLSFLVLVAVIDTTCSSVNDNLQEGRRNARVSGRIVKLYSGPKPDPIVCLGEGFQKDNVDCSVFYRCLKASNGKYTVYRFQCGPGTVYDPETEVCNYPRRTKRLECGGFGTDKLITSTQKYFENEIEGSHKENYEIPSPITTKSPIDLTASSSNLVASSPDKFGNSYVTSYPWITNYSPAESTVLSTAATWHKLTSVSTKNPIDYTTSQTESHTTPRPTSRDNQCVSDGFMGDSEDCRKFYRCVNNQRGGFLRYEFSCSESTIWDDDTQGCNHPWAVQRRRCGKGYIQNDLNENDRSANKNNKLPPNSTIQEQTQISYGSKITQSQVQISNGSVVQNQTQINYGDRLNYNNPEIKQNQTQISHGPAVSQSQTQVNYGNKATQTQVQVDHSNHASQTQTQIVEFFSSTSSASSQNVVDGTNKCTQDGFIGDSNDCSKFYRCVSDGRGGYKRHEFSCIEGTLWDQNLEACNHAWAVKDCGAKMSQQSTQTAVTVRKPTQAYYPTTSSFLNNEVEDLVGYGNQHIKEELEEPKYSTQTVSSSTTMITEPLKSVDCQSNGFFGNADDCSKFYRCIENGRGGYMKYEYKCGDGTVWDSNIESCNHAWAVKQCGGSAHKQNVGTSTTENAIITTVSLIQTTTQKNIYDNNYDTGYGSQGETSQPPGMSTERITGNACKASGFMGDDNDCKKFYRCVGNDHGQFTRHEFTCGEGTVWDPEIEACNHAWAVKRCGGSAIKDQEIPTNTISQAGTEEDNSYNVPNETSKETEIPTQSTTHSTTISYTSTVTNKGKDCEVNGFMGDDVDCKIFYRCVENGNGGFARYQFSCGDGTVWDPKISACNHASAVENCGGGSRPEETKPSTLDSGSTSSTSEMPQKSTTYYTTISASETSTSTTSVINNNQCVNNGFLGDKHNCKKFYRCVDDGKGGFIRYEFSCGEGTVWDPKIQACNHASAVDSCGDNLPSDVAESSTTSVSMPVKDDDDNSNNIIQNTTTLYTTTTTTSKPLKVQNCEQEGFIGDDNDCKKFYRCTDNGKGGFNKYEFTCGEGTVWDQRILACNHESSDRNCGSTQSENHIESSETSATSITTSPSQSTTTSSSDSTEKTESSSNKDACTSEGFYADSNDCKKFHRCVSDGKGAFTKYDFTCGEGTVWVQDILACDHDTDNFYCGKATSTSSQSSQEQSVTPSTTVTPSSTTNSYVSTANDDYTSTISIKPVSQNDDVCQSEGFYPNSQDCTKFYQCVNNGDGGYRKYEFSCSEGTAWDTNTQSCNHMNEVKSCKNSNQSQTKPALQDESTSETSSTTKDPSLESSTTSTTEDPSVGSSSVDQDSCENEGYFGNSKDCKKFYRCVDNGKGGFTKYDFTCGDGTIWDQDITACNHPQDVLNPSCNNTTSSTSITTTASSGSSSETTTKSTSSTSEATETTTTKGDNQTSQSESTKNPNNNNYTCTEAGFYPDPYDCKKFYRCVDWDGDGKSFSIFHFECGEGTIWDPEVQTCNHEQSVYPPRDCSGAQSQNNNGTEETEGTTSKQEEMTESSTTEGTTQKSTTLGSSSTTDASSTTDETSTTQKSTTQQSTTEQSTTQKTTTQQSTTQQSTTEQSTTEQSTTQQSTTEQSTTQQPTTEQSTTQQSATEQSTTQQSTSASEQTTTSEQTTSTTTEQSTTSSSEQSTTSSSEQSTTSTEDTTTTTTQATSESTTAEQSTTQESNTEQSTDNQLTTEQSSTTQEMTEGSSTENGQETTTEKGSSDKECPDTEDDQYLYVCPTGFKRHPKYCNLFYQCTEDDDSHEVKVAVFTCPNNTIYDENKIQCVEEDKSDKKCDGQISQKRRVKRLDANYKEPIIVNRQKYSCPSVGHFPFEKNEECSPVLLKCEATKAGKLRGLVYQCPEGYVYWSISRRCEPKKSIPDCKRSYSEWNGRYEIPTERKNVARKK